MKTKILYFHLSFRIFQRTSSEVTVKIAFFLVLENLHVTSELTLKFYKRRAKYWLKSFFNPYFSSYNCNSDFVSCQKCVWTNSTTFASD